MDLAGKRILITGAAGGLGSATMKALANSGAKVSGIDRKAATGEFAADVIVADLTDGDQARKAVSDAIARLGGLDVLINNAGILDLQDPGTAPDGDSTFQYFDVHILAAWRATAAAMPALIQSRGRVINVSSLFAVVNAPFIPAYCASKRAMAAYSDVLRMQYGDRIGVTTVYPGYMDTPIHDRIVSQGLSVARLVTFTWGNRTLISLEEPVSSAARGLLKACQGRRVRDKTLSFHGRLSFLCARHLPGLVDWFIRWRVSQLVRGGMTIQLSPPQRHAASPLPNR